MKTWDLLNRETGEVIDAGPMRGEVDGYWWFHDSRNMGDPFCAASALKTSEVAYCRETRAIAYLSLKTGEVVYR